jgi:DNA-binding response OmpR family regulator
MDEAADKKEVPVVEDEDKLRLALCRGLEHEGYEVLAAGDGDSRLAAAGEEPFGRLVLDMMLSGLDGITPLEKLRSKGPRTPALIPSTRGITEDRVLGLDLGTDDHLHKPFARSELLARLRACLRRMPAEEATVLRAGSMMIFGWRAFDRPRGHIRQEPGSGAVILGDRRRAGSRLNAAIFHKEKLTKRPLTVGRHRFIIDISIVRLKLSLGRG